MNSRIQRWSVTSGLTAFGFLASDFATIIVATVMDIPIPDGTWTTNCEHVCTSFNYDSVQRTV